MRSTARMLLLLSSLVAAPAGAQNLELQNFKDVVSAGALDTNLAVPESPAFIALGLNPENISRPASPREFASALLTALDKDGNFQAGLALDAVPYMLIAGDQLSIQDYQRDPLKRQLARLQLSLATTKGTDKDDKSVRIGLGVRATPWTRGDPRMDDRLLACLASVAGPPDPAGGLDDWDEPFDSQPDESAAAAATLSVDQAAKIAAYETQLASWEAAARVASEACLAPAEARLNKASAWDLGFAPTWIQQGGSNGNLEWGGGTVWSSFAWNFAENLPVEDQARSARPQLIAHARFRIDEDVVSNRTASGFVEQDSLMAGARLRWGKPSLTFSIEASYLYENPKGMRATNAFVGGINSDIQLYDEFWLQLALGGSAGRDNDRVQVGATIKWGGQSTDLAQIVGLVRNAGGR